MFYFCSDRFDGIQKNKWIRFLICIGIIIFSGTYTREVWFTITNFQWWSGIFLFFVGLEVVYKQKTSDSICMVVALILIGLSTPLGGITVLIYCIPFLYRIISYKGLAKNKIAENLRKNRRDISRDLIKLVAVAGPTLMQAVSVISSHRGSLDKNIFDSILLILRGVIGSTTTVLYPWIYQLQLKHSTFDLISLITGTLIWLWLYIQIKKKCEEKTKIFFYCVGYLLIYYSFVVISLTEETYIVAYSSGFVGGRYFLISQAAFIALLLVFLFSERKEPCYRSWIEIALISMLLLNGFSYYNLEVINKKEASLYTGISPYYDSEHKAFNGVIYTPATNVADGGWSVHLPINLDKKLFQVEGNTIYSIDQINEVAYNIQDITANVPLVLNNGVVTISGWGADAQAEDCPESIILQIGDYYFPTRKEVRKDVIDYLNYDADTDMGFRCRIQDDYFKVGENDCNLIIVTNDKKGYYKQPFKIYVAEIVQKGAD